MWPPIRGYRGHGLNHLLGVPPCLGWFQNLPPKPSPRTETVSLKPFCRIWDWRCHGCWFLCSSGFTPPRGKGFQTFTPETYSILRPWKGRPSKTAPQKGRPHRIPTISIFRGEKRCWFQGGFFKQRWGFVASLMKYTPPKSFNKIET